MVYNQQHIWILMPRIFSLPVTGNIFWAELVARGPFTVKCTVNRFWVNGNMEKRASPYENTGIFFLYKKCLMSVRLIHCVCDCNNKCNQYYRIFLLLMTHKSYFVWTMKEIYYLILSLVGHFHMWFFKGSMILR